MAAPRDEKAKSVCIFDFDGTLVDSMGSFAELAAELMKESYGTLSEQAREDYLRTSGLPFFQQLEVLFPGNTLNQKVAADFEAQKKENYLKKPFFQEVPEAMADLQQGGVRTVISSNNGQDLVDLYLSHASRAAVRFDLVLGFQNGFEKGADHFHYVINYFGISPEEVLFIGDSLHDAQKALEFGVEFVGKAGTFSRSTFQEVYPQVRVVEDLKEVVKLVCK